MLLPTLYWIFGFLLESDQWCCILPGCCAHHQCLLILVVKLGAVEWNGKKWHPSSKMSGAYPRVEG